MQSAPRRRWSARSPRAVAAGTWPSPPSCCAALPSGDRWRGGMRRRRSFGNAARRARRAATRVMTRSRGSRGRARWSASRALGRWAPPRSSLPASRPCQAPKSSTPRRCSQRQCVRGQMRARSGRRPLRGARAPGVAARRSSPASAGSCQSGGRSASACAACPKASIRPTRGRRPIRSAGSRSASAQHSAASATRRSREGREQSMWNPWASSTPPRRRPPRHNRRPRAAAERKAASKRGAGGEVRAGVRRGGVRRVRCVRLLRRTRRLRRSVLV
mmetsp:Transcript_10649/g.44030  ORF Transcript_10649/g.44030 Transcript_10649/m.44030 type:complete len:274 (-) Transcript_10649:79-900(-)